MGSESSLSCLDPLRTYTIHGISSPSRTYESWPLHLQICLFEKKEQEKRKTDKKGKQKTTNNEYKKTSGVVSVSESWWGGGGEKRRGGNLQYSIPFHPTLSWLIGFEGLNDLVIF